MNKRNWITEIENNIPDYFSELKECSHWYSEEHPNPYHMEHEGSVYGHVLDVVAVAQRLYPEDEILHLACLLHDIGKPGCRAENHESQRVHFYSHESFGVFKALEALNTLDISDEDKIRVLELIQRHADSYKLSLKNLKKLYTQEKLLDIIKIRFCDTLGRVKSDDDGSDLEQTQELLNKISEFETEFETNRYRYSSTCYVFSGVPCTGKSSFVSKYKDIDILSRDSIIMESSNSDNYSEAWNSVDQEEVSKLFEKRKTELLKSSDSFIVDTTNTTAKSRMKYSKETRSYCMVFLKCYSEILSRNSERTGKVLDIRVIEDMMKRFQLPYPGEQFQGIKYEF